MKCLGNSTERLPRVSLSTDIVLHHENIELYFDFLYMNIITFLNKNSSRITFHRPEKFTSKSADNIIKEINTVNNMYKSRGFSIYIFHRENQFNLNFLINHIRPESLNIYAKV